MRCQWVCACIVVWFAISSAAQTGEPGDKYQWLEDVNGERPLVWVREHNERTAKVMEADPRFAQLEADALKVLQSPDRLPQPQINGRDVYNMWQDREHVRGILRRATLADYLTSQPHWQTILDYDALGKQENRKWVAKGRVCLYPGNEHCLISLSDGGEDAATLREFNLKTGAFVDGGFVLPHSKQDVAWLDKDTLLVGRDWGPGTMTKSGYPYIVKLWKRGQPLDQAREVFRGTENDVSARVSTLFDSDGREITIASRGLDFFRRERSLLTPEGARKIALPDKANIEGLIHGRLIVQLREDWSAGGKSFAGGSVIALDVEALKKDPQHLHPSIVFAPTATEFVEEAGRTRNYLILTTLDNVQSRVYAYAPGADGKWTRRKIDVPDNRTVSIATTNWSDDQLFLSVTGFLNPESLFLVDAAKGTLREAKTEKPRFDASKQVVEQFHATSKDGTKVPYFVVRSKDLRYDGSNATLLTAYGGFEISRTPVYSATVGKLWLERGGVYVLANIRGGGEFGPAWHEAGLKTHRQVIYDDFAAVAQDLIARKITSSRRLGIQGGSNGGLLMGVEMTQHPEMWRAVVIDVPLLDMLGYEHIAAGASWVGEYGSVSVPAERDFLASISPYHQLKADVDYPEPLLFTTTKDDRVGPVHARKFAAKMEEFRKPFFYQEIIEGGHAAGADLKERAKTEALTYTYLMRKLMD